VLAGHSKQTRRTHNVVDSANAEGSRKHKHALLFNTMEARLLSKYG